MEYTTSLLDWLFLGPATPRCEFTDTNAPMTPQRYYRLRWPHLNSRAKRKLSLLTSAATG